MSSSISRHSPYLEPPRSAANFQQSGVAACTLCRHLFFTSSAKLPELDIDDGICQLEANSFRGVSVYDTPGLWRHDAS